MATGSISDFVNKAERGRSRAEVGSVESKVGAFVPRRDHNPRELKSWAKRTGFVSNFSGETVASSSGKNESAGFDLERGFRGGSGSSPKIEIDPVLGRTKPSRGVEIEPAHGGGLRSESEETMRAESRRRRSENENEAVLGGKDEERGVGNEGSENRNNENHGNGVRGVGLVGEAKKMDEEDEREEIHLYPDGEEPGHGGWGRPSAMRIGLRENPGFG